MISKKKVYKCNHCKGKLVENTDLFIYKDKSYNVDVLKCKQCGVSVTDLKSLKKLRQEIKPTFFERIKNLLGMDKEIKIDLSSFKKVL